MKNKIFILSFFLIFFFCFSLSHSEFIQEKENQETIQHEVIVTLKLIQVYVTDKNGNPVTDLKKEDFILYENGKPKTITDFEKHFLTITEKVAEERLEETKLTPSQQIPSTMNRKFFLFLDIDRNTLGGMGKSKKAAQHFIDTQLQPTDEVGVFSYSFLRGLVIHEYFTLNHKKAKEAVKKIKELPGLATSIQSRRGGSAGSSGESVFSFSPQSVTSESDITVKANNFIDVVKELAKAMRYIPGYKNIILFSQGIQDDLLFSPDQVLQENYEEMSKELATSNSPVYTVNTSAGGGNIPSLQMLSELSGGKFFHKVDYYEKNAKQIQNITSNYYVLGYYIGEKWDGRYQKIKVEVKRKGCIVLAQGGYFNPKPFSKFTKFEKQLHLIDLALNKGNYTKTPYPFPVVALSCPVKGKPGIILISEIQVDSIKEVIGEKTEIVTLIFDEKHNIVDSTQGETNLTSVPQKLLHHYVISSIKPGNYECRVILRNLETGRSALGISTITVPRIQSSGIYIYPPFIMIPNKPCFYFKALKTKKKKKPVATVSLNNIYPFLANNHSPLINEIDEYVRKLLTVLKFSVKGASDPEVEIFADLIHQSSGQKAPLRLNILDSKIVGSELAFLIELSLPKLEQGQYELEFSVECQKPKIKAAVKRNFIIIL